MTKKIKPTARYDAHRGYPTFEDEHTSRRDFLRQALHGAALGGAAALGAAAGLGGGTALASLLGDEPEARAGSRRGRKYYPVWIRLRRRHYFAGCQYHVDRLHVQTRNRRLAEFLGDAKEAVGIDQAVRRVLARVDCKDLTDQKRLARLHRRLGQALTAHYRRRRRRVAATPVVTLELRRRRRVPVPGGIRPVRPPRPAPAPTPRP
jgi:hypothetical protein